MMPEFDPKTAVAAFSAFARVHDARFDDGYVEALAFTSMSDVDDEARDCDLADETVLRIHNDCTEFQKAAAQLLELAYAEPDYGPEQAGRDFWFTRNGHGVGFWERSQLQGRSIDAEDIHELTLGEKLAELCGYGTAFPPVDVYKGDDGKAYLA